MRADTRPPMDDDLALLIRAADPLRGEDPPDAGGVAAQRLLARAKRPAVRRTWRRRRVAIVAGVLVAAATTAAGSQLLFDREGRAGTSNAVDCVASDAADAQISHVAGRDPVEGCRRIWAERFGAAAPAQLTACVDGSVQGSIEVVPGGRDACAARGATVYRGPTAEQLRLVDFRRALGKRVRVAGCLTYPQLREAIATALAAHRLEGWRITDYANLDEPPRRDGCAALYIDEPKRQLVVIGGHAKSRVE